MRFVLAAVLLSACGGAPHPPQSNQDVDRDGVADVRDKCAYHPGPDINSGCPLSTVPQPPVTPPSSYPPTQQPPIATTPPPPPVTTVPPPTTTPAPTTTPPSSTTPPAANFPAPPPGGPYRADDPDHDGFPDAHDRCPDDPEDRDGVADDDGCPD